jgi:epoxyqueuosine reductase
LAGIAEAGPAETYASFLEWLKQGFAGEMAYLSRQAEARRHPASLLPKVRSVVVVGMSYAPRRSHEPSETTSGKVARYAQGGDYHPVLRSRLDQLLAWVQKEVPGSQGRGVVDTAPLLEREFARRAGLGWFGKNTMLLNKQLGSYFFLGALLLDIDLKADFPPQTSHCGSCTACLHACPTQALVAPGILDSRRCLSYLTIELKGTVPEDRRWDFRDWLFGCDICQEVCPWNRKALPGKEELLGPRPELLAIDLQQLLGLSEEDFGRRFRDTALWHARRRGLLCSAALILGNRGSRAALPALRRALKEREAIVRQAAQWAIQHIEALTRDTPGSLRLPRLE